MEGTQKEVAEYLGPRIRRIRRGLDMSQENLADNVGFNRTQMTKIEWGEQLPRLDTTIKLAGGLGVPTSVLIDGIVWEVRGTRPGRMVVTREADHG